MHLGIPVKLRMFVKPTTGPYPGEPCATTRCISEVIFGHPFWDCFGHPFWDCFTRIHSSVGSHNLSKYLYIYIIPNTLWGDGSIVPNLINRNGCWSLLVTAFNIVISKCPYWKYDQSNYLYPKPPPSKLGTPLHYVATPLCQPSTAILGCGTLPRLPLPQTPGRRPHHQPRNGSVTAGVFRFSMASMASNASMAN